MTRNQELVHCDRPSSSRGICILSSIIHLVLNRCEKPGVSQPVPVIIELLCFRILRLSQHINCDTLLILTLSSTTLSLIFLTLLIRGFKLLSNFNAFKAEVLVKNLTIELFLHHNDWFMAASACFNERTYVIKV
jgi:hypothetical protein